MESLRILHVEDSIRDNELVLRVIRSGGYEPDSQRVDTGETMARALAERTWDVVLADCTMPQFDCFQALDVLKAHGEDIPLIIVSGTVGEETAVALMKAGVADYVMKGNLTRLVPAIVREVAEAGHRRARHVAERQLHERERMLSTAQRVAHLGSWERDYEQDTLWWSEELYAILGRPLDYLPSTVDSFADVVHLEDREEVSRALEDARRLGEPRALEHRIVQPDGSVRWVYTRLEPEPGESGELDRLVGTVLDITERKDAEAALQFQARLLDTVEQATIATDLENRIIYWNDFAERLYGWSADEVIGRSAIEVTPAATWGDRAEEIWTRLRHGESWAGELLARRRDGEQFWAYVSSSPIIDDRGNLVGVIGISFDISERKEAEEALRESEANYRTLMEQAADGIVVTDSQMRIVTANTRAGEIFGYAVDEVIGLELIDFFHPDEARENPPRIELVESGDTVLDERQLRRKDGSYFPSETSTRKLEDGRVQIIVRDITERRAAEEALRRSEQDFRNVFENASDGIIVFRLGTLEILDVNHRSCELFGILRDDFIGQTIEVIAPGSSLEELATEIEYALASGGDHEVTRYRSDGSPVHLLISASEIEYQGQPAVMSIQHDVTAQKELERQLRFRTFYDALTGLPNRALFNDRVRHALERAHASGRHIALLMLDLDRFKVINESLGHELGDELLASVAGRLEDVARAVDTVARLGGDEFAFLLDDIEDRREATLAAERIINAFREPFDLAGHEIFMTASIGVVFSSDGLVDVGHMLRNVDVATYRAKSEGRDRYEIFEPEMDTTVVERLRLESDLRRAISRDQLEVHFQPIVELSTGIVSGMEALARWNHPQQGQIPPAVFIPLAEDAGLIRSLGQRILTNACRQWRSWHERHPDAGRSVLNVNLSAQEFQHPDLAREIAAVLDATGLDPALLQLEITESVIMADVGATNVQLRQLKELGVRLAVDDFGTGYSSLSYLKRFPVDTLKVDKSFIDGLGEDPEDSAIVQAIISLARALALSVTAEGVESREIVGHLDELGCDWAQGYYYSPPRPATELEPLWANGLRIGSRWQADLAR